MRVGEYKKSRVMSRWTSEALAKHPWANRLRERLIESLFVWPWAGYGMNPKFEATDGRHWLYAWKNCSENIEGWC